MHGPPRTPDRPPAPPPTAPRPGRRKAQPCPIVGGSPAIQRAVSAARQAARSGGPVLILGERGTGKELFARLVHEESGRAGQAMVPVNCASLGADLAEAQIFGHRRGAFTGATETRTGLVGAAEGGTLFLDEVGELPLDVQARLLRLLQEQKVRPVGEAHERAVNVRIVAATNRDLQAMVEEGRFRADLLDRLRVWEVRLPPLRARKGDLRALAERWLAAEEASTGRPLRLGRSAGAALAEHDWPGNVRELQRVLTRAAARTGADGVVTGALVRAVLADERAGAPARSPEEALFDALSSSEEPVSMGALLDRTGLPRSTLKALAARLVDQGRINRTGDGRSTRYRRVGGPEGANSERASEHPLVRALTERLREAGSESCASLARALGVSPSTALRALHGLVSAGAAERVGLGRNTLYRLARASEPPPPQPPKRVLTERAPLKAEAPSAVAASPAEAPLSDLDAVALDLARARGSLARRELAALTGVAPRTALRSLGRLLARGLLVAEVGRGCATRYRPPGTAPSALVTRAHAAPAGVTRRTRPRAARPDAPDLSLTVALVVALQRGQVEPDLLHQQAGVPRGEAQSLLERLTERGLLVRTGERFVLAPLDRPPPGR